MSSEAEKRYYARSKELSDEFQRALRPYNEAALDAHYKGQQDWGDKRESQVDAMAKHLQLPIELAQRFVEEKGGNSARFTVINVKEKATFQGEWALVEILVDRLNETPGRVEIYSETTGKRYAINGKGKKMKSFEVYSQHNEAVYDDVLLSNTLNYLATINLGPNYPQIF